MKLFIAASVIPALIFNAALAQTPAKPAAGNANSKKVETSSGIGSKHRYNYGMAGCGVGSLVVEGSERQNDKVFQIIAGIINNYTGSIFSISSGSSNCRDTPQSVARMEQEVFISVNMNSMNKEAAQGDGHHLAAFAEVLGCGDTDSVAQFVRLSQNRYDVIFADSQPNGVLNRYLAEIKGTESLADKCSRAEM